MQIKYINPNELIPYKKNTKKHDETQIKNVAESIEQFGFVQPIVIDKNNVVVIGHCRLLAALHLNKTEVPCISVDELTDKQVKALRIIDNKSNESPWEFDFLKDELREIDLAYKVENNPKIAVEVLIGHGVCHIIAESSVDLDAVSVCQAVHRITGCNMMVDFKCVKQDVHLARNQSEGVRCGDNGIFKGVPLTEEQKILSFIVKDLYEEYRTDGKYILDKGRLIACQSNAKSTELEEKIKSAYTDDCIVNPLGEWTGGTDVDTGATNRKLGSDMADSVTGGGLHGKDLSKADVSVNIYAFLKAQETGNVVTFSCAIGDEHIDGKPYSEIVEIARKFIKNIGGFEKFAEWGLY